MNYGVHILGALETKTRFTLAAATVQHRIDTNTRMFGRLLVTRIQAHASGRPGPNAPTGNYRRSWHVEFGHVAGALTATAGTNAPQGPRLEFGFVGVDSLGRHYDQPPYPHVAPALSEIKPQYESACRLVIRSIA